MPGYLDSQSGIWFGWDPGEDGWGVPTNRSLRQIAYAGIDRSVKGTVSSPPSNPTLGDKYLVGASPTGWGTTPAPLEHQLAVWGRNLTTPTTFEWIIYQPRVGSDVFDEQRGVRVQYYEGSWQEIRPSKNQPILSDNTITGDGVDTPQSVQFPDQLQSDWNVTDTASARFIKNKPVIPRAIEPTFWTGGPVNISTNLNRGTGTLTIQSVRLSDQLAYAHNLGRLHGGTISPDEPELRIGFGARLTISGSSSQITTRLIANTTNSRNFFRGNGTYNDYGEIASTSFTVQLRVTVRAAVPNYRATGSWYAGLLVSP